MTDRLAVCAWPGCGKTKAEHVGGEPCNGSLAFRPLAVAAEPMTAAAGLTPEAPLRSLADTWMRKHAERHACACETHEPMTRAYNSGFADAALYFAAQLTALLDAK